MLGLHQKEFKFQMKLLHSFIHAATSNDTHPVTSQTLSMDVFEWTSSFWKRLHKWMFTKCGVIEYLVFTKNISDTFHLKSSRFKLRQDPFQEFKIKNKEWLSPLKIICEGNGVLSCNFIAQWLNIKVHLLHRKGSHTLTHTEKHTDLHHRCSGPHPQRTWS